MAVLHGLWRKFAQRWGCEMVKKTPASTEVKTSALVQRDSIEQGQLFDGPALCPTWPNPGTLDCIALEMLLSGQKMTHPDFQSVTHSWRLAACIERLIKVHGWPIDKEDIPAPTPRRRWREIRRYHMRPTAIALVKGAAL